MEKEYRKRIGDSKTKSLILPIMFAVIVSLILTQLIIFVSTIQNGGFYSIQNSLNSSTIVNLFLISIISLLLLFGIFRLRKFKKLTIAKVLVFIFIEGGMLSILLFGKLLFTLLGFDNPIFILFFLAIAYTCTYFAFLNFFDSLSLKARNRLFIISSGSLGSFLGLLIPIVGIIVILIILSGIDLFLIQTNFFKKKLGQLNHEKFIFEMAFSTNDWGIGIGDLICYSIIVSSTFANFGIIIGSFSLFLLILGSLLTMKFTTKEKNMPGLPISLGLGILPSLIVLIL
jgi:hypothetical protein